MKTIGLVILAVLSLAGQQAHVNLEWNPQANRENFKPFGAAVISPEVHADRRVTFRVNAAAATEVPLAGGPLQLGYAGGERKFVKGADGIWSLTIGPVAPNMYLYNLVIDGATVPDPNNTLAGVGDQPPYSMLVVPGDGPAYYDAPGGARDGDAARLSRRCYRRRSRC
jgi:enterochelin esterase family protein